MTTFNSIYWGIKYNENFWEYNSPYDYYLFSEMLILIKQILGNNEKYINMLDELYDLLWENIAMNFHRAMRTMTGPQSDQSKLLTSRYFALFLEKAVGIQLSDKKTKIPDNILSRCPRKYIRYFYDNKPNRFIQQLIGRGSSYFYFTVSQIASNYLQPEYAIGSFNRQQFWRAHTPIAAYLKSEESKPPYFIRLKVLNDNHDYSSGELHCVQNKGIILGHIIFSTNRGDKHPDYDLKYGKLISSDFRIRFEINGNINNLEVISGKNSLTIKYKNITLRYRVPLVCMDNIPVTFELKKNKEHMYFDVVFTIGPNSEIDLTKLKKAICQFVLQITASDRPLEDVKNTFEKGYLVSELPAGDFKLKIESPHKPDSFEYLNTHDRQYINDIRLEQYTALNQIKTMQYRFIADSNAGIDLPAFSDDSDILKELENLKKAPIEKINNIIKDYLDRLSSNNFTLDIFKRYAVHIAILLFERASAENFQFEQIIKNNYYNIYQNISAAPSTESVCKLLLKMTEMIQKDNEELDIKLKKTNTVSDVIEIIDNNYQNPLLSLSMIAEMLGLSEYYISRAFKKNTNTNYVKYLIRVRMEKAKELLDDGIPAENAAKECGYMNIFSFKRAFKSYTGMTITDWKKHRKLESAK